jgi:L-gulonolactone oxidase
MITFDPVSTAPPGWQQFLDAYNEFCIEHDGRPLFNQSPRVTPSQVKGAFSAEIAEFQTFRRRLDPDNRLYSGFFRERFE